MVLIICVGICPHWYIIYSIYFFKLFFKKYVFFIVSFSYASQILHCFCLSTFMFLLNILLFTWGLHRVFAAARRLSSCGAPALGHTGSAVVTLKLGFNVASGILVPSQGLNHVYSIARQIS